MMNIRASAQIAVVAVAALAATPPAIANQGCWVTCHNSMRDMPNAPPEDAVEAHPVLGKADDSYVFQ